MDSGGAPFISTVDGVVEVRSPDSADEESALQLTLRQAYENFAAAETLRLKSALEDAKASAERANKYYADFPAAAKVGDSIGARFSANGPLEPALITDIGHSPDPYVSVRFLDGRIYKCYMYHYVRRFGFIPEEPAR